MHCLYYIEPPSPSCGYRALLLSSAQHRVFLPRDDDRRRVRARSSCSTSGGKTGSAAAWTATSILTDPLSSRVHAIVTCENGEWWVRDAGSRNGTYVNGPEDRRSPAGRRRHGSRSARPSSSSSSRPTAPADQLAARPHADDHPRPQHARSSDTGRVRLEALRDSERAHDFLTLHQLSMKLLGCTDPDEVDPRLARAVARADEGLGRRLSVGQRRRPAQAQARHSRRRGRQGPAQRRADRAGHPRRARRSGSTIRTLDEHDASLQHYADAICVPLVHDGKTLGAIHVYLEQGRFRPGRFRSRHSAGQHPDASPWCGPAARRLLQGRAAPAGRQGRRLRRAGRRQQADARAEIARSAASPGPRAAC